MKFLVFLITFTVLISGHAHASDPKSSWTAADVSKKLGTCLTKIQDLFAKAKGGDAAAAAAIPAEQKVAAKCLITEEVFPWMFYYGYEKTGIYAPHLMGGIGGLVGTFDWIGSIKEADKYEAYCDASKAYLHQSYCYISLLPWWMDIAPTKTTVELVNTRLELYFANIDKSGNEVNKQIFALPESTPSEKLEKTNRLSEATEWWFEDAAKYMDLRDPEEKAKNAQPPLIIEGFRRCVLALLEIIRLNPKDLENITNLIWMQSNVDANELELAEFRGKKASFSTKVVEYTEKFEKNNSDDFFFYSFIMDNYYVGIINWQMSDHAVRKRVIDYYQHILTESERTISKTYNELETLIKANPAREAEVLGEFVKSVNSVISAKVRIGYFSSLDLVGGMKDAREARKLKGSIPKPIRLGAGVTPEQEAASKAIGATHIVKTIAEVKTMMSKSVLDLTR